MTNDWNWHVESLRSRLQELNNTIETIKTSVEGRPGLDAATELIGSLIRQESESEHSLGRFPFVLNKILKDPSLGALLVGPKGEFILYNGTAVHLLGPEFLSGHADDNHRFFDSDRNRLGHGELPWIKVLNGQSLPGARIQIEHGNNSVERWLSVSATPFVDETGQVCGAIVFLIDSTEEVGIESSIESLCDTISSQIAEVGSTQDQLQDLAEQLKKTGVQRLLGEEPGRPPRKSSTREQSRPKKSQARRDESSVKDTSAASTPIADSPAGETHASTHEAPHRSEPIVPPPPRKDAPPSGDHELPATDADKPQEPDAPEDYFETAEPDDSTETEQAETDQAETDQPQTDFDFTSDIAKALNEAQTQSYQDGLPVFNTSSHSPPQDLPQGEPSSINWTVETPKELADDRPSDQADDQPLSGGPPQVEGPESLFGKLANMTSQRKQKSPSDEELETELPWPDLVDSDDYSQPLWEEYTQTDEPGSESFKSRPESLTEEKPESPANGSSSASTRNEMSGAPATGSQQASDAPLVTPPPPKGDPLVTPPPPKSDALVTPPPPKEEALVTPPPPKEEALVTPPPPNEEALVTPPPPNEEDLVAPPLEESTPVFPEDTVESRTLDMESGDDEDGTGEEEEEVDFSAIDDEFEIETEEEYSDADLETREEEEAETAEADDDDDEIDFTEDLINQELMLDDDEDSAPERHEADDSDSDEPYLEDDRQEDEETEEETGIDQEDDLIVSGASLESNLTEAEEAEEALQASEAFESNLTESDEAEEALEASEAFESSLEESEAIGASDESDEDLESEETQSARKEFGRREDPDRPSLRETLLGKKRRASQSYNRLKPLSGTSELDEEYLHDEPSVESQVVSYSSVPPEEKSETTTSKVLVVDDIPVNQKLLILHLKRLGYEADIAGNGEEALEKIAANEYELVLMDCDMPVMNGFEAAARIRANESYSHRRLPIIALTSYDREGDREKCIAAGMDDYITKGASRKELKETIERSIVSAREKSQGAQPESDSEEFEEEVLDINSMLKLYGKEEVEEISSLFLSNMGTYIECMQLAIDEKDSDSVVHFSSAIKGPCAALGIKLMTRLTSDIIGYAEDQDWTQVRVKYMRLKAVFVQTREKLKKVIPNDSLMTT